MNCWVRWHAAPSRLQRAFRYAADGGRGLSHVTVHPLRHCFPTHLMQTVTDIPTIQQLLGHSHVDTTMIYTPVTGPYGQARGPLDRMAKLAKESVTSRHRALGTPDPRRRTPATETPPESRSSARC